MKSDLKRNQRTYLFEYILRFYLIPIAIWPLVFNAYISFTQIGLIFSAAFICQTLLELPSGALADIIGRKKTIIIAHVFRIFGFVMVALGNSFLWFLFAELFDKANEAFHSGSAQALMYDSMKENGKEAEFEKFESKSYFWATTLYISASILGGFLYIVHPKLPYVAMIVPTVLGLVSAFFYQEPKIDTRKFTFREYLHQNVDGFKHIFRHTDIALISFYSLSVNFVFLTGLWWLYQKAANEVGLAPQYVGLLIGFFYGMRSLGSVLVSKLDKANKDKKLIWLSIFQGVFSLIVALPGNLIGTFGLAGRYLTDGVRQSLISAAQNKHIESKYRATALSAVSLLTSFALAATNPVIGWGIDMHGARFVIGVMGGVSLLIALPLAVAMKKRSERLSL